MGQKEHGNTKREDREKNAQRKKPEVEPRTPEQKEAKPERREQPRHHSPHE